MIASRPSRFINLDHGFQTMSSDSQIVLFIGGANLYATAKALGFEIDYRRLLKEFRSSAGVLLRAVSPVNASRRPSRRRALLGVGAVG
jgi:hypothetical protein